MVWISVTQGCSGWFAVMLVEREFRDEETNELIQYVDIECTGFGRYDTKEEAIVEAKAWAKNEDLLFKE